MFVELNFAHQLGDKECASLENQFQHLFRIKKCRHGSSKSYVNHSSIARVIDQLDEDNFNQLVLEKLDSCCTLAEVKCKNDRIYIAGRYLKYSRELSQTPWFVTDHGKSYSSVQEKIVASIEKFIGCQDLKFCASGREDVDVRMLGRGRPFLFEVINPSLPNEDDLLRRISEHINEANKDIQVKDLQLVSKSDCNILKEGEEKKSKTYKVCND